jgi:dihydrofolate synthase/folylpolyglutamate synthase
LGNKPFSTYDDVLDYIFRQLPMYQRQGPKALKYDLSNISAFMDHLGNPHRYFRSIHIAGTNGKGSTAHYLAAAFQMNGYRTGLYTSPHYRDYRERIKIDGNYIEKGFILDFFNEHLSLIAELKPSYFELSVALAFAYFLHKKVDIAIIEVGLGGRLDSTNIIDPLLSLITNISWDHMQTLGNTLQAIAGEKAGIIKAETPVVIGDYQPELIPVFEKKAEEMNAPLHFSRDYPLPQNLKEEMESAKNPFSFLNMGYAWAALQVLKKYYPAFTLDDEKSYLSFQKVQALTRFMGRWQQIDKNPGIIVDGAHNTDGWETILEYLEKDQFKQLHIVLGFVFDKSYLDILPLLPRDAKYYFCQANIPRALDAGQLKGEAKRFGLEGEAFPSVKKALDTAKSQASASDLILVSGSIFVAGEVL